jgi:hypothetical protein
MRLRSTLREYFPAAINAFEDLTAEDALLLLARASSPARAAKLTRSQVVSALRAARRHHVEAKADALLAVIRAPGLRQPATTEAALCCRRFCRAGRHHHGVQRADRTSAGGGGRAFWSAPGG